MTASGFSFLETTPMPKRRVAFFEFPVFQGVFPLASGYLEATACSSPLVRRSFDFEKHSYRVGDPGITERFDAVEAEVYAFSCYVWNTGLVRRLLARLFARRPGAHVMLGGPQVMNKSEYYLAPEHPSLVLCNGEGEYTFTNYLAQLASGEPEFSAVNGMSFYRDGELITTPKQERVRDLDELPSPYLDGYLDARDQYVWAVVETNRGCPFRCTYCYWGAATNAKVHRFHEDRVFEELTWLSERGVPYIFIADANFGMLRRDVEIARHLAECRERFGAPLTVYFSSSKNTPERVTEITRVLDDAGLVATQPISLQTMSPRALDRVKRSNIKSRSYIELQRVLNERRQSSFLEMIWPLPGETLSSFKRGLGELCSLGADSFIVYPLLLINNVEMDEQREEHGLVTIEDPDPNSEAQIVVRTRDVSDADYAEGLRFAYHLTSLYSVRGLRFVGRHLCSTGAASFDELISDFSDYCERAESNGYIAHIESTLRTSAQHKFSSIGGVLHYALHEDRARFDRLLRDFMRSRPYWGDEALEFMFELDLLNRPHVYRNTPIIDMRAALSLLRARSVEHDGYTIEVPERYRGRAARLLSLEQVAAPRLLRVRYRTTQLPYMEAKPLADNFAYCQDRLHKMTSIMPVWTAV